MTTLHEAAQQALEALSPWSGEDANHTEQYSAYHAIREALAEQPVQQEPVAWRNAALRVGEDLCSVGPFGYYDMTAEQWLDWALSVVTVHSPPAQRKPLTDEEIESINVRFVGRRDLARLFARAIEAAHGIKENT